MSPELAGGFLSAWPPRKPHSAVLVSGVQQNGSFLLLYYGFDDDEGMVAVVSAVLFPNTQHSGCFCWMPGYVNG